MSLNAISLPLVVAILSLVDSTNSQILPHDERPRVSATTISTPAHPSISRTTVTPAAPVTAAAAAAAADAAAPVAHQPSSFVAAFMETLSMVFVSELGDNTFFIAAIMAMKFSRTAVFMGATLALVVMTFVSVLCGSALSVVPKIYTYYCSLLLLCVFGVKMIADGVRRPDNGGVSPAQAQYGSRGSRPPKTRRPAEKATAAALPVENANLIDDVRTEMGGYVDALATFWQIFAQAFTLTFLGEWGDRSQIATMVLTLNVNKYGIVSGSFLGHIATTGLAVVGGRMVAQKISVKMVSVAGGLVFIIFAFVTFCRHNAGAELA